MILEQKLKRLREEEAQAITVVAVQAYGRTLKMVTQFKYLGCVLIAYYDYWPVVVANICKAWSRWSRLSKILGQEGEDP